MPTPGIFYVTAKLINPALPLSTFQKWYDQVHFPDILKTSGMTTTFRYDNVDANAERPIFCCYPVADIAFLQSEEFFKIPVTSDLLPGPSHLVFQSANFDTRYYELVQVFEPEGTKPGPTPFVLASAMTPSPGSDADLDTWYRQEYVPAISQCAGHVRTRRYKLATDMQRRLQGMIPGTPTDLPPTWLALHDFGGEGVPRKELKRIEETEWARKVLGGLQAREQGVWRLGSAQGDVEVGVFRGWKEGREGEV